MSNKLIAMRVVVCDSEFKDIDRLPIKDVHQAPREGDRIYHNDVMMPVLMVTWMYDNVPDEEKYYAYVAVHIQDRD